MRTEGPITTPQLWFALAATSGVIVVPAAVVAFALAVMAVEPPVLITAVLVGGVSAGVATIGSALWTRHPASATCSFGELMVWSWLRRRRAEKRVARELNALYEQASAARRQRHLTRNEKLDLLRNLSFSLEEKDPYLHGHSRRVERLVARTAIELRLPNDEIEEARKAAALHDVGKVQTPDTILRKPGALTIEERAVIEKHVLIGARMVARAARRQVVEAVRHHHERWDGRGYPDGLTGYDIPLIARIIAVADTFDAMTSTRPYRAGYDAAAAIEEIRLEAGAQFDPTVVDAFLRALPARIRISHLVFAPVLGRILRNSVVWGRRTSTQNLGPAVAAVGAATVIGLTGIGDSLQADAARPRAQPSARGELTQAVAMPNAGDRVWGDRGNRARETPARAGPRTSVGSSHRTGAASVTLDDAIDDAIADAAGSTGGGVPLPRPSPTSPGSQRRLPPPDPKPERGRDCPGHPERGSENLGHEMHCRRDLGGEGL